MDDKSSQYVANHEILYKDEFTKQLEAIKPGSVLTKDQVKTLGDEQVESLLKKKAIKLAKPERSEESGKKAGVSIEHTKADAGKPAVATGGDGFNT